MKIIETKTPVNLAELTAFLSSKLVPAFKERRQTDIGLQVTQNGNTVTVAAPNLYDSFLFQIEDLGTELHIIKSEHYTDDVNVLTLEDILNSTLLEYPGRDNINFIAEES
ncbi:hypothetical protein [Mucilaginibacter lacusdianchii]|uniref:hypothetical protein n=1 Tax=Mucilaginibacter lacusdianchii TaxID=2684211 RepID=UPI00131CB75D|nr:hypothetical protein [Mucilaginibacter sp. JXJ CY 39]